MTVDAGAPRERGGITPRQLTSAVTLVIGALCLAGFVSPRAVAAAMLLAAAAGAAMRGTRRRPRVVAWLRRAPPATSSGLDTWWDAQSASYMLAAVVPAPALLWPGSVPAVVLLGLCFGLALLSALTPFCLGRFLYVVVFAREGRP